MRRLKKLILFLLMIPTIALANQDQDIEKYIKESESKIIYGPATAPIKNTAKIQLSYGQAYLPEDVTKGLFKLLGKNPKDDLAGLIMPGIPGDNPYADDWGFIALEANDDGHISDDDAKNKDLSTLLDDLRKNIKPETKIEILDWIAKPTYNQNNHIFTWSFSNRKDKNDYFDAYQAYVLGRSGLVGFTYISKTSERTKRQPMVSDIISSIKFKDGYNYNNYVPGTDKLSSLGLAALVAGGITAKKLGLFALLTAGILKFSKVAVLAFGSILTLLRIRKKKKLSAD